jgi:CRP-like cAMP-binding protein
MAECAMPTAFEAGELIFKEGDVANRFYLIERGSVALESKSNNSESIRIQTIGAGDVLGWSWLFPPYLWHFDARAIETSKVLFIYGSRLRDHCEDDHDFGYEVIKRIAEVMMARLQATRWQLFQISDLALKSQWEALNLAAQLGSESIRSQKHYRPGRSSTHFKPQLTQKNDRIT